MSDLPIRKRAVLSTIHHAERIEVVPEKRRLLFPSGDWRERLIYIVVGMCVALVVLRMLP